MKALFIDLPNFYSHFLESGIAEPRLLRDYFLYWLDFDRLAEKLTGELSSVWVFYSGRRFGPKTNRIQDEYLDTYIERINSLPGVTARDVDIDGKQREQAKYECENCGKQGVAQWESEKGIDTSMTVHLFDTMDSWDTAYLLSGDADFIPAVASLRRRGKIVIGAGFGSRSSSLVRECYNYIDLCKIFLKEDIFAYRMFMKNGIIDKWLHEYVKGESNNDPIQLSFEAYYTPEKITGPDGFVRISSLGTGYRINLFAKGQIDMTSRHKLLEELKVNHPENAMKYKPDQKTYSFFINDLLWKGVKSRLTNPVTNIVYEYNSDIDEYESKEPGV